MPFGAVVSAGAGSRGIFDAEAEPTVSAGDLELEDAGCEGFLPEEFFDLFWHPLIRRLENNPASTRMRSSGRAAGCDVMRAIALPMRKD